MTTLKEGTYVYDKTLSRWVLVDESSFIITFNPGGGEFTETVIPKIKILHAYIRETDGSQTEVTSSINSYYKQFNEFFPYITSDDTLVYIWPFSSADVIKLELAIKDLPTPENHGMSVPPGFDTIRSWEMLVPYHEFKFDQGQPVYDENGYYKLTLTRSTTDNICQCAVYPYWNPARDGNLRCLISASGLGSLDFGNIQSVNTTYNSKLTTIPIVCYGYKGTYCMDLGVSKTINLSYIRINPDTVDNTSADSRLWDNATWISKLRDLTDRWQMRTNGCLIYLKRPDLERLTNGFNGNDPMSDYINEIDGENCYISSAPVKYVPGKPNIIQSSITVMMGTLYPKQPPVDMIPLTFEWADDNGNILYGRKKVIYFPKSTEAMMPALPHSWKPVYIETRGGIPYYDYGYGWKATYDGSSKKFLEGEFFDPAKISNNTVYVNREVIGEGATWSKDKPGNYTLVIKKPATNPPETATIQMIAIGGGGGGGGGHSGSKHSDVGGADNVPYKMYGAGGGGGASGGYQITEQVVSWTGISSFEMTATVGAGGKGGSTTTNNSNTQASKGNDGTESTVSLNVGATSMTVTGIGGKGGTGANAYFSGDSWSGNGGSDGGSGGAGDQAMGSYKGGNGGVTKYTTSWGNSSLKTHTDGEDGSAPSTGSEKNNNFGAGGLKFYQRVTARNYIDNRYQAGSGGGGGAFIPSGAIFTSYDSLHGGSGYLSEKSHDAGIGCGGCGGNYTSVYGSEPGGDGGNGKVFILVIGGTIQEK